MRKSRFQKQLTIAIPSEHFEQIQRITDREEISIAEYCREALAVALKNNTENHSKFLANR